MNDEKNNMNDGTQTEQAPSAAMMTPEDLAYFKKMKEERLERERKEREEQERQAKRDEVWQNFKKSEEYEILKDSGIDNFFKQNSEFLDNETMFAKGVRMHKLEIQAKQNSNGATAGEPETTESAGTQKPPSNSGEGGTRKKNLDINSPEFMEDFANGNITLDDIDSMEIDLKNKILLKQNHPAATASNFKKFFGNR